MASYNVNEDAEDNIPNEQTLFHIYHISIFELKQI